MVDVPKPTLSQIVDAALLSNPFSAPLFVAKKGVERRGKVSKVLGLPQLPSVKDVVDIPAEAISAGVESVARNAPTFVFWTVAGVSGSYFLYRKINDVAEIPTGPLVGVNLEVNASPN